MIKRSASKKEANNFQTYIYNPENKDLQLVCMHMTVDR